jgi:small subunit ribosomal protein S6
LAVTTNREYELVLMLDPEIPEERREQITSEARTRIESGGELKHDTSWGMRKLAYEIRQRTEADYRFFRFETGGELLTELDHNLRIADGVLRFRIFKVDPRSPTTVPPAPVASTASAPTRGSRRQQGGPSREEREPAKEASEPAAEKASEPPAEPAAEQAPAAEEAAEAPAPEPAAEQAPAAEEAPAPEASPESEGEGSEPASASAEGQGSETSEAT